MDPPRSDDGSTNFRYDDASAMRCARCGTANEMTYAYDGANIRVHARSSAGYTYFVHGHDGSLLWEEASDGSVKEHVYVSGREVAVRQRGPVR